jgi:hypothetical protein
MRTILIALAAFSAVVFLNSDIEVDKCYGATCINTGEDQSGGSKICYYDCHGRAYSITIPSTSVCPFTIER